MRAGKIIAILFLIFLLSTFISMITLALHATMVTVGISTGLLVVTCILGILLDYESKKAEKLQLGIPSTSLPQETEVDILYKKIQIYPNVGTAKFLKEKLEFKVEGKFAYKKDFKGIPGYHFAFKIKSNEITYMPPNYDNICGYDGFCAEVGYFEEMPLADENDCGVIVQDLENLQNKTITLDYETGYVFHFTTVEMDDIDYGQITILEFNKDYIIVAFKLAVNCGLNDVVVGTAKLTREYVKKNM